MIVGLQWGFTVGGGCLSCSGAHNLMILRRGCMARPRAERRRRPWEAVALSLKMTSLVCLKRGSHRCTSRSTLCISRKFMEKSGNMPSRVDMPSTPVVNFFSPSSLPHYDRNPKKTPPQITLQRTYRSKNRRKRPTPCRCKRAINLSIPKLLRLR